MNKKINDFRKEMERKDSSMQGLLELIQNIEGKNGFSSLMLVELKINTLQRIIKTESITTAGNVLIRFLQLLNIFSLEVGIPCSSLNTLNHSCTASQNETLCKKAISFETQIKKLFEDFLKENNLEVKNEK